MWSAIELVRPLNCAMSAVGVLIGGFLVLKTVTLPMVIAFIAALFLTGAGNAINDFFDIESDKINRPKRPIPAGRLKKNHAVLIALVLFAAGISLAATINWLCILIAAVNSVLLVLYSFNLQDKILVGNLCVSYLVASTFIFGGAAVNNFEIPFILALLAGLATLSREIVKDLEDLEGDRASFLKKVASKIKGSLMDRFRISPRGIKLRYKTIYAILIASFSLWMAVLASLIPYMWEILGLSYLTVLIPTDAVFIYASYILIRRRKYSLVSRLIKTGMFLGLLAFLVGIFV